MFGLSAISALMLGAGGAMALSSMGGSDQPDTSGMNRAAETNSKVAADTLDWYKEKDAANKPMQDKLANKAYEVADQQLVQSKQQSAIAADYDQYNKGTFRPLEQRVVADAQGYDTPQRRQAAADSAMADNNMAFANSNDASARRLAANGIDPGSTRSMSAMQGQDVAQATANAGAAYKARQGIEAVGQARQMDAASLGRGLASSQATAAQGAIQAGNSSVANTQAPITAANQSTSVNGQGFGTAIQGNNSAGNLYGQAASIQQKNGDSSSGAWGALGTVAGSYFGSPAGSAALAAMSDENMKTDISEASDADALEATNATPVKKWKYDPAKMAAAGVAIPADAQGENIGPMAQDVSKNMGDEAAPGGKKLNLVTMNGIAMKSIQAVDSKVGKLTKQVNTLAGMIRSGTVQAGAKA